jgi:hypothetical protein
MLLKIRSECIALPGWCHSSGTGFPHTGTGRGKKAKTSSCRGQQRAINAARVQQGQDGRHETKLPSRGVCQQPFRARRQQQHHQPDLENNRERFFLEAAQDDPKPFKKPKGE